MSCASVSISTPICTSRTRSLTGSTPPISITERRAGLARVHAGGDLLVDQQVERRLQLVVELALDAIALREVAPQAAQSRQRHDDYVSRA